MKKGSRIPNPRLKRIVFGVTKAEEEAILQQYQQSTCTTLAIYVRDKIMGRTIHVKYRNTSMDDLITEMMPLKNALMRVVQEAKQFGRGFSPEQQKTLFDKTDQLIGQLVKIYDVCSHA